MVIGILCNQQITVGIQNTVFSTNFSLSEVVYVIQSAKQKASATIVYVNGTADTIAQTLDALPSTVITPILDDAIISVAAPVNATLSVVSAVLAQLLAIVRMRWAGAMTAGHACGLSVRSWSHMHVSVAAWHRTWRTMAPWMPSRRTVLASRA